MYMVYIYISPSGLVKTLPFLPDFASRDPRLTLIPPQFETPMPALQPAVRGPGAPSDGRLVTW